MLFINKGVIVNSISKLFQFLNMVFMEANCVYPDVASLSPGFTLFADVSFIGS